MSRFFRIGLIAAFFALSGSIASAAFSVTVTQTSALPTPAATYSSNLTTQSSVDILSGPQQLLFGYIIGNNPANSGGGFYKLDSLQFFYSNSPSPISLQVTITETAANFLATGASLTGFASFEMEGNVGNTLDSGGVTFSGLGSNTINFPSQGMNFSPTLISGTTDFTSLGATGTITSVFNVTLQPFSNATFGDLSGSGFGSIGVQSSAVPLPATAFLGLFAVPTLAVLRRRIRK